MERRGEPDRRRVPRGGRRAYDRPGVYPPVLVADSYEGVRTPCARYLQSLNFDVLQAADGEEALSRIVASPPKLILAEWDLPTMPATRLVQWIAQRRASEAIPVIVLANAVEADGLGPQIAGVLCKPFSLSSMVDEVRRVLRNPALFR